MRKLFIILLLGASCGHNGGINFNPDFYIGDYENSSVVNEIGLRVYADTPEFNNFACMTKEKAIELMKILSEARISKKKRKKIVEELNFLLKSYN